MPARRAALGSGSGGRYLAVTRLGRLGLGGVGRGRELGVARLLGRKVPGRHAPQQAVADARGRVHREEGEALLERRSGEEDNPRILQAFNEKTPDWLSFFMFTYFTDRDGKYQLASLAESGFDPLARSCRFMLTE